MITKINVPKTSIVIEIENKEIKIKNMIGYDLKMVFRNQLDLDVTECLGLAYEEIKNRKGKMINGTFVKEEDL